MPLQGDLLGCALLPRALPRADVFNPYRVFQPDTRMVRDYDLQQQGKTTSFDGSRKKFPNLFEKVLTNCITRNLYSFLIV